MDVLICNCTGKSEWIRNGTGKLPNLIIIEMRVSLMSSVRYSVSQCSGTVIIYCGYGSGSGSESGTIQTIFSTVKKIVQNLSFLMLEATLSPSQLTSTFDFFFFTYMLDPEPECIPAPVPLMQRVAVPVPQRCRLPYSHSFYCTGFLLLCRNRPALDDGVCGGSGLGHGLRGIPTNGRVCRPDYGRQRFPGSKY